MLAIDPGTVRVGLALSDPTGMLASPAGTVPAEPSATLVERLAAAAREKGATELVVGLARRMDGTEGPEAKSARRLAGELRSATGLQVSLVDERLSSVAAERTLIAAGERRARRRHLSDPAAAAIFLQTFLDSPTVRRSRGEPPAERVTLLDEDGVEREFVLHDAFDMDGATYFLVEMAEDPEVVLLLKESADGLHTVDREEFDSVLSRLESEDAEA